MKRYLLVTLITSTIMMGILAAGYFFLSSYGKNHEPDNKESELDLLPQDGKKEQPDMENVIPLKWKGKKANVLDLTPDNVNDIYNAKKSKSIKGSLDKKKLENEYTIDAPLWAKNPFGTNELSFYLYFKTPEEARIEYSIYVKNDKIPNFTRTPYNGEFQNLTREHEYQIIGLVPGMDNYITLKLFNKKGTLVSTKVYKASMESIDKSIPVRLTPTKGYSSKESLSKGLFFLLGKDGGAKGKAKKILAYDNSGTVRVSVPLKDYRADRIEFVEDTMYYGYSSTKIAQVSSLGQVLYTYDLGKYRQHHDYAYNGYGQLWILATDTSKNNNAVKDVLISLDVNTGKVKKLLDFQTLFPQAFQKAKKSNDGKTLDWIDLNSIVMISGNDAIVSARKLSSIIKLKNVNTKLPSVDYILSDESNWRKDKNKSLLFTKVNEEGKTKEEVKAEEEPLIESILPKDSIPEEVFESQSGQNNVNYETEEGLGEGQYYLTMFNNNTKGEKSGKKSSFYKYLVDEVNKTYQLTETIEVPYSNNTGSVQSVQENKLINSGKADSFGEYDKNGALIYEYSCPAETYNYRIFKHDMSRFWFYR